MMKLRERSLWIIPMLTTARTGPWRYLWLILGILCHIGGSHGELATRDKLLIGVLEGQEGDAEKAIAWAGASDILTTFTIPQSQSFYEYDIVLEMYDIIQRNGIVCVIGMYDRTVAMVTEKLGISYITTSLLGGYHGDGMFYILPKPEQIVGPLIDLMDSYHWQTIGVIYEESLDPNVINTLISKSKNDMKFFKVPLGVHTSFIREIILSLRDQDVLHYLLLTTSRETKKILRQARKLGIIAKPFSWIVLNLGSSDIASGILNDLRTNVTLVNFVKVMPQEIREAHAHHDTLGLTLIKDAIIAVKYATLRINLKGSNDLLRKKLLQSLFSASFEGQTGYVAFDSDGRRTSFTMNIYMYGGYNFTKIGHWMSTPPKLALAMRNNTPSPNYTSMSSLYGKHVKVVTILERPFAMLKDDPNGILVGNDRFEGFAIDIMRHIADMVNFKYEIYLVPDGKFGTALENGEWNGIIGEVLSGNATMSMAPLSINSERENVVDFTKPFKGRGVTVLMKTPESQSWYFQFMRPLSSKVWFSTLIALVTVSALLYALEKYSLRVRKDFGFRRLNSAESAWFIFGSLVQGSTESTPVTVPGRIITSAWWFFALILISTYTANLAAFLTVKKIYPPISSVADLVDQTKIRYGTVRNSGIETFFKRTKVDPFKKMWLQMSTFEPDSLVNTTEEGLLKAKEGNYAFLWDSTVTGYVASVDCGFTEIGPSFDPKGFGIAVPPGAIYREELSLAILRLADSGDINELENKWWDSSACPDYTKPTTDETTELELENVAGIFFVLVGGIALAAIAFLLDCVVRKVIERKRQTKEKREKTEKTSTL